MVLEQPYLNAVPAIIGQSLLFSAFRVDGFEHCGVLFTETKLEISSKWMLF